MKRILTTTLALAALATSALAQHGHLNAGAVSQTTGAQLTFANGSIFAAESGYVKALAPQSSGTYAGFYQGAITFTALPTTLANGGPTAGASAPGSFIEARISSVQGPAGGYFSFWDEGATTPTFSLASGTTGASVSYILSDPETGAGTPGGDPFGHHHGRAFTASLPGEYTVGFSLFDSSKNGPDGGAIHTPSDTLFIRFSAIPEPGTLALFGAGTVALVGWSLRRRPGQA